MVWSLFANVSKLKFPTAVEKRKSDTWQKEGWSVSAIQSASK